MVKKREECLRDKVKVGTKNIRMLEEAKSKLFCLRFSFTSTYFLIVLKMKQKNVTRSVYNKFAQTEFKGTHLLINVIYVISYYRK